MPRRALLAAIVGVIGAAARPVTAQVLRDANCDGVVNDADRPALVGALFVPGPPSCPSADINRDGRLSAADLIAFASGPRISYLGMASLDGRPAPSLGTLPDGAPVYFRNAGFGFLIVIEAAPSADGAAIGTTVFNSAPNDPNRRPDLQILVDHPLGDGSRAVCDDFGVPAVDPPDFALVQPVSDAINDLACRFVVTTTRSSTCTQDSLGQPAFVSPLSRAQFCLSVDSQMAFAIGETRLTVQLRDAAGLVGTTRQMVLQIGSGPAPPTFTPLPPTPTRTATETPSPSPTASRTPTASATPPTTLTSTATPPPTRLATASSSPTAASSPTAPRTGAATLTPTPTTAATTTATITRLPTGTTATRTPAGATVTPLPIACIGDCDGSGDVTIPELIVLVNIALGTADLTTCQAGDTNGDGQITVNELVEAVAVALDGCSAPLPTRTAIATPTRAPVPTSTSPPTAIGTPPVSPTPTLTLTPAPTATGAASGPVIIFLGLTGADDFIVQPSDMSGAIPIYTPPFGYSFSIIVEAKPGAAGASAAKSTYNPGGTPDLQIEVNQPLGDGSAAVCDDMLPMLGGVPATAPPDFGDDPGVADRLNDLGCRFIDGVGQKIGRTCDDSTACVLGTDGQHHCAADGATVQFCGPISQNLAFPSGDTLVTARVRDVRGNLGPAQQLIMRVP